MAIYDACKSLYMTLKYSASAGSPWAGETWQTGLRVICDTDGAFNPSDGRVTPNSFSVQDSGVSRTISNYNIQQGWSGVTVGGSTITDVDVDALISSWRTWQLALVGYLGNQFVFTEMKIYPLLAGGGTPFRAGVSATAPVIVTPSNTTLNPSVGQTIMPDASIAISLGSATRGVSGRGRMFLGGLAGGTLYANGLIVAAAQAAIGNASAALVNSIRAIDTAAGGNYRFTPVIYTRVPSKTGANADTASVINSVRVSDEFDTQRRRDSQRNDVYTSYGTIV